MQAMGEGMQVRGALSAKRAKGVTGQIFAVRANEIFLMSQSRIAKVLGHLDGGTPEIILDGCFPAMQFDLYGLSTTADIFKSDPV